MDNKTPQKKPLRKVELQFTAFITIESIHDPIEELKTFCEDHDLQFCDVEIERSETECQKCGQFVDDSKMYANDICFDCYEGIKQEDEDQYRGER